MTELQRKRLALERVREKLYECASITLTNLFERRVREDERAKARGKR